MVSHPYCMEESPKNVLCGWIRPLSFFCACGVGSTHMWPAVTCRPKGLLFWPAGTRNEKWETRKGKKTLTLIHCIGEWKAPLQSHPLWQSNLLFFFFYHFQQFHKSFPFLALSLLSAFYLTPTFRCCFFIPLSPLGFHCFLQMCSIKHCQCGNHMKNPVGSSPKPRNIIPF